ncbi:MAG: hypothetical protein ACKOPS_13100, partial [Cyanobium sp.]
MGFRWREGIEGEESSCGQSSGQGRQQAHVEGDRHHPVASTAPTSGAAASRTEPSDLLIVQRGATPYKATAEQLKSYMLTPAT